MFGAACRHAKRLMCTSAFAVARSLPPPPHSLLCALTASSPRPHPLSRYTFTMSTSTFAIARSSRRCSSTAAPKFRLSLRVWPAHVNVRHCTSTPPTSPFSVTHYASAMSAPTSTSAAARLHLRLPPFSVLVFSFPHVSTLHHLFPFPFHITLTCSLFLFIYKVLSQNSMYYYHVLSLNECC